MILTEVDEHGHHGNSLGLVISIHGVFAFVLGIGITVCFDERCDLFVGRQTLGIGCIHCIIGRHVNGITIVVEETNQLLVGCGVVTTTYREDAILILLGGPFGGTHAWLLQTAGLEVFL